MDEISGALAVAAAGLTLAALAMLRFGLRQRSHRGWALWVAALGSGAIALLLASVGGQGPVGTIALAMLLPWPVLALIGMRRFHGRLDLPASERSDWLIAAAGSFVVLVSTLLWPDRTVAVNLALGVGLLVQLYAAAMMWSSRTTEEAGPMRLLGGVIALTALAPLAQALSGAWRWPVPALAAAAGLAVMAFTVLAMMGERTERELRHSRRRLKVLASTDPLTGVPNRRRFNELVERSLRADLGSSTLLLLFDIDHFKLINDKFGHATGDRALRLVGQCMNEALRAQDVAGRLGGDEFVLMLRGTSTEQALAVASRIVTQLQAQSLDHRLPCLGLSFGIARLNPGETTDDALRRADQALYEAKRQGRSRAVTAEGDEATPQFSESCRLGLTA